MHTLAQFIAANAITMTADRADANPHMEDMPAGSSHYRCTLRKGRRRMTVYFSQGRAIRREPSARDVLGCIASDTAGHANARTFEGWCDEYGYSPDSRKAEHTWKVIGRQAKRLRSFLGDFALDQLLWNTEAE
jgi:hypothetical protein